MNYLKQINGFWNWRKLNTVNHPQVDLYFTLLDCANTALWQQDFSIPNSTLLNLCQCSKTQLHNLRNQLVQLGLIQYTPGKNKQSGTYNIIPLYDSDFGTHFGTHSGTHSKTNPGNTNKEKEKENVNKIIIKKNYKKNVLLSDGEYQQLLSKYSAVNLNSMLETLDNYKESSGKSYDSDYAAINRWVAKSVLNSPAKDNDVGLFNDTYNHEELEQLTRLKSMR